MKKIFTFATLALVLAFSPASVGFAAKPDHAGGGKDTGGSPEPVAKSVCIDPGHGGADNGTSNGGYYEDALNLDVAAKLSETLSGLGYTTYLTRTDDVSKSNNDRYTFCNSTGASLLVSVHHNGSTDSSVDYTMALYQQRNSFDFATNVGSVVNEEFNPTNTLRVSKFPSGVLIKSNMPSMMSESYFLTNSERLAQLQADYDGMVLREANALARGVEAHLAQ